MLEGSDSGLGVQKVRRDHQYRVQVVPLRKHFMKIRVHRRLAAHQGGGAVTELRRGVGQGHDLEIRNGLEDRNVGPCAMARPDDRDADLLRLLRRQARTRAGQQKSSSDDTHIVLP